MIRRIAFALGLALVLTTPVRASSTITLDARDAELSDVLRLIGVQGGLNVIPDGSIKPQRVSLHLHGVDREQALTTLAQAFGLQMHRDGSIVIVGDAATMSRRYDDLAGVAAPRTELFSLSRAKPDEVAPTLAAALPPGTVVVPDKRTATVIVTSTAPILERARKLIAALDGPAYGDGGALSTERIALRNAKPAEALKALKGVIPDNAVVPDDRSNAVVVTGSRETIGAARSVLGGLDLPGRQVTFEVKVTDVKPNDDSSNVGIEFGGSGFGSGALGSFPYTLTKSSVTLNAQINALVQTGRAQILATPRIATLNNHEASLLVGEQYPVVTVNQQTGFPSVTTVDVGVQLRLTPTIGADGAIIAELHPSYSQIIGFNSSFPIIANRKVDATLRVHDGETIVLGGLFEDTTSETVTKFPLLGDLPILGPFFRNKATTHQRDEVVFFITPHILDASAADGR